MSVNPFIEQEAAYSIGYAKMLPIPIKYDGGNISFGEFRAELFVSIGAVGEVFSQNHIDRNVSTPGPCFDFRAKIPGKMSGAPVFGGGGAVIRGVVSKSFQDERHAYGSILGPAMDLPLDGQRSHSRTLRILTQQGNEGMAKVHGLGL